jgi:GNAT superfamily N-acetyltransferase
MWLTDEDREVLQGSGGFAVLCFNDTTLIGGAYAVPAEVVAPLLREVDPEFSPGTNRIYIFSVAVVPEFRRQGIGTTLRGALLDEAKARGYTSGATRIRPVADWHQNGKRFYKPRHTRVVDDFWPDQDPAWVQYQEFTL